MTKEELGRVVLICGGVSSEREVSLMSGAGVEKALREAGVDVTVFDPKTGTLSELEAGHYDRAFIALHGRLGEDGGIQGVLNCLGVPYTGPGVTASAITIDKEKTKILWRAAGIPVPEGRVVRRGASDAELADVIGSLGRTGLVVKPAAEGSSVGLTKLDACDLTPGRLREAVDLASGGRDERDVLVEEFIRGRELTVAVLDGRALPAIDIQAPGGDYDYRNKYFGNAVHYECPAKLEPGRAEELARVCERAFAALGCRGWSRVDVMERADGRFALLEINTSPGMTPHSLVPMAARAVGMDYTALCLRVLALAQTDA